MENNYNTISITKKNSSHETFNSLLQKTVCRVSVLYWLQTQTLSPLDVHTSKSHLAFGNNEDFISKACGKLTAKLTAKSSVNPRKHQVSIWTLVPVRLPTHRWSVFDALPCLKSQSTVNPNPAYTYQAIFLKHISAIVNMKPCVFSFFLSFSRSWSHCTLCLS